MKRLTLVSCLLVITCSANANILQSVKNDTFTVTQNKKAVKKQSFKDFLKSAEKIKGQKLNWRERIKLSFVHVLLPKAAPESRNKILLSITLVFLMLLVIALAILIVYLTVIVIIHFTGGIAAISTPSG